MPTREQQLQRAKEIIGQSRSSAATLSAVDPNDPEYQYMQSTLESRQPSSFKNDGRSFGTRLASGALGNLYATAKKAINTVAPAFDVAQGVAKGAFGNREGMMQEFEQARGRTQESGVLNEFQTTPWGESRSFSDVGSGAIKETEKLIRGGASLFEQGLGAVTGGAAKPLDEQMYGRDRAQAYRTQANENLKSDNWMEGLGALVTDIGVSMLPAFGGVTGKAGGTAAKYSTAKSILGKAGAEAVMAGTVKSPIMATLAKIAATTATDAGLAGGFSAIRSGQIDKEAKTAAAFGAGFSLLGQGLETALSKLPKSLRSMAEKQVRQVVRQPERELAKGKDVTDYVLDKAKVGSYKDLIKQSQSTIDELDESINAAVKGSGVKSDIGKFFQETADDINAQGGKVTADEVRDLFRKNAQGVAGLIDKGTKTPIDLEDINRIRQVADKATGNKWLMQNDSFTTDVVKKTINKLRDFVKDNSGTRDLFDDYAAEITFMNAISKASRLADKAKNITFTDLVSAGALGGGAGLVGGPVTGVLGAIGGVAAKRAINSPQFGLGAANVLNKASQSQLLPELAQLMENASPALRGLLSGIVGQVIDEDAPELPEESNGLRAQVSYEAMSRMAHNMTRLLETKSEVTPEEVAQFEEIAKDQGPMVAMQRMGFDPMKFAGAMLLTAPVSKIDYKTATDFAAEYARLSPLERREISGLMQELSKQGLSMDDVIAKVIELSGSLFKNVP